MMVLAKIILSEKDEALADSLLTGEYQRHMPPSNPELNGEPEDYNVSLEMWQ